MVLHMVETLVRGGVTRNLAPRPARDAIHRSCPLSSRSRRSVASPASGIGRESGEGARCGARGRRGQASHPRRGHRVPPQNLDAEESVLGAMMLSTEADRRRRRDPRARRLLPLGERPDLRRDARTLRPRRAGRHHHRRRRAPARGHPRRDRRSASTCRTSSTRSRRRPRPPTTPTIVSKSALRRRLISAAADIMDMRLRGRPTTPRPSPTTPSNASTTSRGARTRDEMAILRDLVDQAMFDLESIQNRESAYTGLPTGFSGPRHAHVRAAARQPDRDRGPTRASGKSLARHEHRPQHRGHGRAGRDLLARDVALGDRHAAAVRRGAGAVGPDPQQAGRPRRLDPRRAGGRDAPRRARCRSSTRATSTSSTSARRRAACAPGARASR